MPSAVFSYSQTLILPVIKDVSQCRQIVYEFIWNVGWNSLDPCWDCNSLGSACTLSLATSSHSCNPCCWVTFDYRNTNSMISVTLIKGAKREGRLLRSRRSLAQLIPNCHTSTGERFCDQSFKPREWLGNNLALSGGILQHDNVIEFS